MARGRKWRGIAGLAALSLGGAVLFTALVAHREVLDVSDKLASVVGAALAALGLVYAVRAARPRPLDSSSSLEHPARALAYMVSRQWNAEAVARGFMQANPLRVRWESTTRPVQVSPTEIVEFLPARVTRLKLHGDMVDVTNAFRRLPRPRLVVIGAPGAGKSSLAMLLTLGLSRITGPGDPIPVLANLAAWNPRTSHLDTWFARQLAEQYPKLAGVAGQLVAEHWVMPVLDALDEIPGSLQMEAIAGLAEALGDTRPFVLTCRAAEYERLMGAGGLPLARAAVIELQPASPDDVAAYLPGGQIDGERRWAPVLAELRAHRDSEISKALATPLMVYLARTAYASAQREPSELLEFRDAATIEKHLLATYVPSIYGRRSPPQSRLFARRPYSVANAERWLAHLATDMSRRQTVDLAWWDMLSPSQPILRRIPAIVLLGAATATIMLLVSNLDLWLPVAAGLMTGLAAGAAGGRAAARVFPLKRRVAAPLLTIIFVPGAIGTIYNVTIFPLFIIWAMPFLSAAIFYGQNISSVAVTPQSSLRRARLGQVTMISYLVSVAAVFRIFKDGSSGSAADAFGIVILSFLASFPVALLARLQWLNFGLSRIWFSMRRKVPVRLMKFLADAHRRGVLRQVGAIYQFRHARVQEHLAHLEADHRG